MRALASCRSARVSTLNRALTNSATVMFVLGAVMDCLFETTLRDVPPVSKFPCPGILCNELDSPKVSCKIFDSMTVMLMKVAMP